MHIYCNYLPGGKFHPFLSLLFFCASESEDTNKRKGQHSVLWAAETGSYNSSFLLTAQMSAVSAQLEASWPVILSSVKYWSSCVSSPLLCHIFLQVFSLFINPYMFTDFSVSHV